MGVINPFTDIPYAEVVKEDGGGVFFDEQGAWRRSSNQADAQLKGNFERNDFHWLHLFDSLDGFYIVGDVVLGPDTSEITLTTTTTIYSYAQAIKKITGYSPFNNLSWNKNKKLRCSMGGSYNSSQEINIRWGGTSDTDKGIGFKVVNNTLYGTVANGSTETTVVLSTITTWNVRLEVRYTAGEKADFYVDEVYKGSISTNLPTGDAGEHHLIYAKVKTNTTAIRNLHLYGWEIWQAA